MIKKLLTIIFIAICLFVTGYYSIIFASNKLSNKADIAMHNAANQLKEYYKNHGSFPEDINGFFKEKNIKTVIKYWPFSTEIKAYAHSNDMCNIEYLQVPFGPLAGINLNSDEFYYSE